jgi:hypothetical protein
VQVVKLGEKDMKTKCYSVRLDSMVRISDRCYKATAFDGSSDLIPASQVFGVDYEVVKSDAYWISAWILEKKNLQYSCKKVAWFDENGNKMPKFEVSHHTPEKVAAVESNEIDELKA